MTLLRKKITLRLTAVTLLILLLLSTFQATVTYALTVGPLQPEYTSYEEPGSTDMVNLLTGDFTFSLPILDVPGPEGGLSVPLVYNAGIGLEQEASWVGLGWTLNAGAITRNVVQYPDDASGESQAVTMKDLDASRGWESNIGIGRFGWNNNVGHYGAISILGIVNFSWDDQGFTYGALGINYTIGYDGSIGVSFDAAQFAMGVINVALTLAIPPAAGLSIATQAAISIGIKIVSGFVSGASTPNAPTDGDWQYSKEVDDHVVYKNYWIWLDQTRNENMLGVLNFDFNQAQYNASNRTAMVNGASYPLSQFTTQNGGGFASDISYYIPPFTNYSDAKSPIKIATDNFSVKAQGISGSISPYRLDMQTVSMPRSMAPSHQRFGIRSTKLYYKTPFFYDSQFSNAYFNQLGAPQGTPVTSTGFYDGVGFAGFSGSTYSINNSSLPGIIRQDVEQNNYKMPRTHHVEWFSNREIVDGKSKGIMMDYFSSTQSQDFRKSLQVNSTRVINASISNGTTIELFKFDFDILSVGQQIQVALTTTNGQPQQFTTTVLEKTEPSTGKPFIRIDPSGIGGTYNYSGNIHIIVTGYLERANQIGGYAITGVDGKTYHFALPIYEYGNYTKIEQLKDSQNKDVDPNKKYSEIKRDDPFASAWLLTGITGPDYVDRNGNGMIDKDDWGYWVKLTYGRHTNDYGWAVPYTPGEKQLDSSGKTRSRSEGKRQQYYLNSIQTRSHVALFFKENRSDALGIHSSPTTESNADASLRLKEIALIPRSVYESIYGDPAFAGGRVGEIESDESVVNLTKVYMLQSTPEDILVKISQNALKRIRFNYSYDLCRGIPNTTTPGQGKSTLVSVSMLGRNNVQIMPDFKFEYANNPNYNKDQWDGWGAYSSQGTSLPTSHTSSSIDSDGTAWSLTKITTPLGSTVEVDYERDEYGSVSGNYLLESTSYSASKSCSTCSPFMGNDKFDLFNANSSFSVGDRVVVKGTVDYSCSTGQSSYYSFGPTETTISAVTTNELTFSAKVGTNYSTCPSGATYTGMFFSSSITKKIPKKKGGNIRVKNLKMRDDNVERRTTYLYNDLYDPGMSSGVVASEPDYVRSREYDYQYLPNYPFTPVMYGTVTVLNGNLANINDYHTKEVYQFETPSTSVISDNSTINASGTSSLVINRVSDYTSRIGKLISKKVYRANSTLPVATTQMNYASNLDGNLGIFAERNLMIENVDGKDRLTSTSIVKYPYTIKKIESISDDGFTSSTENKVWDFITGIVTEKTQKSSLGVFTKSVTKLAYTVPAYAEMGSKAVNINNKNMLGHEVANYSYLLDANGNSVGLLGASVTTWKSDWSNYRFLNTNYNFVEGSEGPNIWRKHQSWVYKGNYSNLRPDGSLNFSTANEFDFSTAPPLDPDYFNNGWQKTSEVTRYNHYSAALEGKDLNNIFSASKNDVNQQQVYASATNANYFEFAYSGAEDWAASGTGLYLGGEVAKGSGTAIYKTPNGNETHTGQVALQLSAGAKGFVYKPASLTPNRTYRISAWTNSPNGAIYYKLNAGTEQVILPVSTQFVNGWYQINALVPVSSFTSLEVGVKSTNGTVSFDDFRFQPLDGALTANVYDPVTSAVTFTLDNQNMFTQYEYNDRGQLVKTYSESFKYGIKLVSESKMNYRRFNTNP